MARFDTTGFDDIFKQMQALDESTKGKSAERILHAGAEEVKKAWRIAAGLHGLKYTGDMIDSIGFSRKVKSVAGIKVVDIYPMGKDRKGVRNAEKAFILHYGSSSISATHWVDDADQICDNTVVPAMEEEWSQIMKEKGL